MTIEELIANLTTDAHTSILPKADECTADEARMAEPANAWLTALPAQDAILWPTRVFPGL